jgi:hypothetical protein
MGFDIEVAGDVLGVPVANLSGLDDLVVLGDHSIERAAAELQRWVAKTRGKANMFNRATYTPPDNPYDEMRSARTAVATDDIVSGVAEVTEGFAFQGMKWESEKPEDADVFNQMAGDLNMDNVIRKMWREEFTYSSCYVAAVWGRKEYKVRGSSFGEELPLDKLTDPLTGEVTYEEPRDPKTNRPMKRKKGPRRKKTYSVYCPTELRVLDPTKVVPLGTGPLGMQSYAWCATEYEMDAWEELASGRKIDIMMSSFFLGKYTPDRDEERALRDLNIDTRRLLVMNPDRVFAHHMTKPDYERFPDVRLKSCFALLDLKNQLLAADRATLVGAANYILLVKKGSKEEPAQQREIDNLKENYQFMAKLPVIISDHRLELEIIAPNVDLTLNREKYDTLDARLLGRLLGTLSLSESNNSKDATVGQSYAVARALENRRHMLRRTLERQVARAVVEHPANDKVFEGGEPNLVYTPRHVALGWDQALLQLLHSLRTEREISRETMLEMFGLDQATEAMRLEIEEKEYDDTFRTMVPFSSPQLGGGAPPGVTGPQGGRPVGGGQPSRNTAKPKPKTPAGNTSTKKGSA